MDLFDRLFVLGREAAQFLLAPLELGHGRIAQRAQPLTVDLGSLEHRARLRGGCLEIGDLGPIRQDRGGDEEEGV